MWLMIIVAAIVVAIVFFTTVAVKAEESMAVENRVEITPIDDFDDEQNRIYLEAMGELDMNDIEVQPSDVENRIRSGKPLEPVVEAAMEVTDYDSVFNWDVLCEAEDCGIGAVALTDVMYPDEEKNLAGEQERVESLLTTIDEKHHHLIYIFMGLLQLKDKKYNQARAHFEKSVELSNSDLTKYVLGFTYIDEVDPKVTITQARKALQVVKGKSKAEYLICYYIFDTYRWEKYIPKQNPPSDLKESARLVIDTLGKISFKEKSEPEQQRLEIIASWSNLLGAYNTIEKYEELFASGYSDSSLFYECHLYYKRKGNSAEAKAYLRKATRILKGSFLKNRYSA